jgi:DNA-binding PadR family transcriptional regulator
MTEVREPTFLVLVALASDRLHGYGIIREVERLSNGKTVLRAGTLYATLDRLSSQGLIEGAGEEIVDGRLRRYYRLSDRGSAILESESKQRVAVSKEALRRLRVARASSRVLRAVTDDDSGVSPRSAALGVSQVVSREPL